MATELLRMDMVSIEKMDPYHVKVEVFENSTEHLYEKFGFVKNEGTWLLEHGPTGRRLHAKATSLRSERSEANKALEPTDDPLRDSPAPQG